MNKKVIVSFLLALALLLSGCQSQAASSPTAQQDFDQFIEGEFIDTISSSYINMHQNVIDISKYGINRDDIEVTFGHDYTTEDKQKAKESFLKTKETFLNFDRASLTSTQQNIYDIMEYQINLSEESLDEKFSYMSSLFSPMAGLHTIFPNYFRDFVFYSKEDIEDMIILMNDLPRYINEALEYTKIQKDKGYMMSNDSIDQVIKYATKIVESKDNSPVLEAIISNINNFKEIDNTLKTQYINEVTTSFHESFIPTYQHIIDTLTLLKSEENNTLGLAHVKNGKEYYEYLFKSKTGSNKSIQETEKDLKQLAKQCLLDAQITASKNLEMSTAFINNSIKSGYQDFNVMLEDLNQWSKQHFPTIQDISYHIQELPIETANSGVSAYYNTSPIDNIYPDTIRVNMTKGNIDDISTFVTIAHEGFPGHMYQRNYTKQHLFSDYLNVCTHFLGYTEGYATYVSYEALELLDIDEDFKTIYTNLEIFQNSIISLLDIGIHYHGWDKEEAKKFFESYGLAAPSFDVLYNQLQADPGAFLPYYIGYMEIKELRDKAEKELGEKFNTLEFHTVLIQNGEVPFKILKQNIENYIQANK